MTDNHLDLLDLDAHRAGEPLGAAARAHIAWCPTCQATLADLDAVASSLKRAVPSADVPADREAAILAIARDRAHLAAVAPRRRTAPAAAARWAAAALLVLTVGALVLVQRQRLDRTELTAAPASRAELTRAQADLNGDGTVDVLDAFALARAVVHGTPQVGDADRHDVDLILAMAVSLDGVDAEDTP